MNKNSSKSVGDSFFYTIMRDIRKRKALTADILKRLFVYRKRFLGAIELLVTNSVKKYTFIPSNRTLWIVVGRRGEYMIYPEVNYCTCYDFYLNVLIKGKVDVCRHIIAKELAEAFGLYEEETLPDEYFEIFISDWKKALKRP